MSCADLVHVDARCYRVPYLHTRVPLIPSPPQWHLQTTAQILQSALRREFYTVNVRRACATPLISITCSVVASRYKLAPAMEERTRFKHRAEVSLSLTLPSLSISPSLSSLFFPPPSFSPPHLFLSCLFSSSSLSASLLSSLFSSSLLSVSLPSPPPPRSLSESLPLLLPLFSSLSSRSPFSLS